MRRVSPRTSRRYWIRSGRIRYFLPLTVCLPITRSDWVMKINLKLHSNTHCQYTVSIFGLVNAPSVWITCIRQALGDAIGRACLEYMDDIIVMSTTPESHADALWDVWSRLKKAQIFWKPKICVGPEGGLNYGILHWCWWHPMLTLEGTSGARVAGTQDGFRGQELRWARYLVP